MFWTTGTPLGHVALVVKTDGSCDPDRIKVVSNDVLDRATGNVGAVHFVTLREIENGYVPPAGYLCWSPPVRADGVLLLATRHPLPQ